jgi:hypothetical protein
MGLEPSDKDRPDNPGERAERNRQEDSDERFKLVAIHSPIPLLPRPSLRSLARRAVVGGAELLKPRTDIWMHSDPIRIAVGHLLKMLTGGAQNRN